MRQRESSSPGGGGTPAFSFFSLSHRLPLCLLLSVLGLAPLVSKVGLFSDPETAVKGRLPREVLTLSNARDSSGLVRDFALWPKLRLWQETRPDSSVLS